MKSNKQTVIASSVFIIIFTILFTNMRMEYKDKYEITIQEIKGLQKITNIHKLNIALKSIRGLNQLEKSKIDSVKNTLFISDEKVFLDIVSLNDAKIKSLYEKLQSSKNLTKKIIFQKYTKILKLLDRKRFNVADNSFLLLESNRDMYFLMSIAVLDIPDSIENIGKIRAFGTRILSQSTQKENKDGVLMENNIQIFLTLMDKIKFLLTKLNDNDQSKLNVLTDSVITEFYDLNQVIKTIKDNTQEISPQEYFLQATKLVNNINNIFLASKDMLNDKLIKREKELSYKLSFILIIYILMILMIVIASCIVNKRATRENISSMKKQLQLKFINKLRDEFANNTSLKYLCDKSLNLIINNFKAINGSLYLYNSENEKLYLGSSYGIKSVNLEQTLDLHENIISENILEKEIKIIDIEQNISLGNIDTKATKLVTIPIMEFKNSIGTVQLLFDSRFKDIDIELLQEAISLMASYIFKAQKDDESLKYLKLIDKNVLISKTDLDGNITEVSEEFCNISLYSKEELIGQNHSIVKNKESNPEIYKDMWNTISNGNEWRGEFKNMKKDGTYYWIDSVISPDCDINGNTIGYTAIRTDITDKKKIEEIAITDGLTSLFNRRHFDNIFTQQIEISKRAKGILAFLLIDIDHFKQYNDTYGHQEGDIALKLVANALKQTLKRPDDYTFRLGGEEFGLLFHISNEEDGYNIANLARKNIEDLKIMHSGNSASPFVTISSGLYIIKSDNTYSEDDIYKKSDEALYTAKNSGRNQVSKYEVVKI